MLQKTESIIHYNSCTTEMIMIQ